MRKWLYIQIVIISASALLVNASCASTPYRFASDIEGPHDLKLSPGEPQTERGKPHRLLDGLGHYLFSLPSKLILWNWKVDNHNISEETEAILMAYLEANDLHNVKVRLNQYAPGAEWRRLVQNNGMAPGWRYSLGAISLVYYTAFPGRLFGGDNYNPYTNTINLYSDLPAIALHEAGHARDFTSRCRNYRGFYALIYILPFGPLHHEAVASGEAIGYLRETENPEVEKSAYKLLYPAYATYIGGEAAQWAPSPYYYPIMIATVVPAHIAGRIKAAYVKD